MKRLALILTSALIACPASSAQNVGTFPKKNAVLADVKHKEPKSGVRIGPGNTISIQSGVGTPTTINVLSFSGDSKFLVAGKDFGRVVVWDVATRNVVRALDTQEGIVTAAALSHDGALVATAGQGDDFRLRLWQVKDGKLLRTYDQFTGYVHSVAFGAGDNWIITADNTGTTRVFDVHTGVQNTELKGEFAPVLSEDGSLFVTVSKDNFSVWETKTFTKLRSFERAPKYAVPLSVDSNRETFAVSAGGHFRLLRLTNGELLPSTPKPELPMFNPAAGGFVSFQPGTSYLFGHSDGRLWAWDVQSGSTCVSDVLYSESGALSPNGKVLAGAKDNSILAQSGSGIGVWVWDTTDVNRACFAHR